MRNVVGSRLSIREKDDLDVGIRRSGGSLVSLLDGGGEAGIDVRATALMQSADGGVCTIQAVLLHLCKREEAVGRL